MYFAGFPNRVAAPLLPVNAAWCFGVGGRQHWISSEEEMTTRGEPVTAAALTGPLSLAMKTSGATEGEEAYKMADFLFARNARAAV